MSRERPSRPQDSGGVSPVLHKQGAEGRGNRKLRPNRLRLYGDLGRWPLKRRASSVDLRPFNSAPQKAARAIASRSSERQSRLNLGRCYSALNLLFQLVREMFKDAWEMRLGQAVEAAKTLKSNVTEVEKQIEKLLDRLVGASNESVVSAYEKRISKLEREKALAEEKLLKQANLPIPLRSRSRHAMTFLSSPWNIWRNPDLVGKKVILRPAFLEPLTYRRNEGLRAPNLAFPFRALDGLCGDKSEMAPPGHDSNV